MWPFSIIKRLQNENEGLRLVNKQLFLDKVDITELPNSVQLSGSPVHLLAELLFKQYNESGAENFLIVELINHVDGAKYEITMQKCSGETTTQQLKRLKTQLAKCQ